MILFVVVAPKCASGHDATPAGSTDPIPNVSHRLVSRMEGQIGDCLPTEGGVNIDGNSPMVESPICVHNANVNTQSPPPTGGPPLSNGDGGVDFSPADIETSECAVQAKPPSTLPSPQPDTSDHDTGTKRHRSASAASSHHSPQSGDAPALPAGKVCPGDLLITATPSPKESSVLHGTRPGLAASAAIGGQQEPRNDMMQAQSSRKRRRVVDKTMQGVCKYRGLAVYS